MKKKEIVRSSNLFNQIIKDGKKISNSHYVIYFLEKEEKLPNFGVAVSKKIGNAVMRNKIKRQLRNIVDNNKMLFKNYYNYIIMIRKEYNDLNFYDKEDSFKKLLGKVNNEK